MKRILLNIIGRVLGYKRYTCPNCKKVNYLKDNGELTVGYCSSCDHPIWNDIKPK